MLNFILNPLSSLLGVNLHNAHDVPFALPLMMFSFLGFCISMIVLHFIGNEKPEN
jgi:hypothetical protein